jgi:hypothetical protein
MAISEARDPQLYSNLVELVAELVDHVERTQHLFASNMRNGVVAHPIPFFGDLLHATVATVGLNPSAGEFVHNCWPRELSAPNLTERLLRYFDNGAHPWFDKWESALKEIGGSYRTNAVHLDISPRATVSAGSVADPQAFDAMCRMDLEWLIRFVDCAPNLRLLLLAGTGPSPSRPMGLYLNRFMQRRLVPNHASLEGSCALPSGRGKVQYHTLVLPNRRIPVFFCSSSPSDRTSDGVLVRRLRNERDRLREYFDSDA